MLDDGGMNVNVNANMGERTYAETVARGFYGKNMGGLFGKYDNVRAHWEDAMTRVALRPFVRERVERCVKAGRGVRILDLGCGAGQGYEQLIRIDSRDLDLADEHRYVLRPEQIELYLGLDLSEAMVEKGRENYHGLSSVRFDVADLREGIGKVRDKAPFDIYFSSYGALSHLEADALRRCLHDIAAHARPGAIVVLDLLGRFSPEWPGYWSAASEAEKVRPYSMSYLYPPSERQSGSVEQFPIRFWTGSEVRELAAEVSGAAGVDVRVCELLDRSIFVGRHVDTREYGTSLPPLRSRVNQLYEQNIRTNLELLRAYYRDVTGQDELNGFFREFTTCWNVVVDFTIERLRGARVNLVDLDGWRDFKPALQMALMTIDRIIDGVAWIDVGDVRANVIEPQLAYVLRRMQHKLQEGRGCGHGLVAVLQIGEPIAAKGRTVTA
ncbi:MAG: class I SAM-dependent methyltransferase [Labilithrix sp.]|nr:class I SAM-dependent methyltransferase [Labilithrix sp.]MCW5837361.1 class I SAM-dependent methyltransferase [Labilithrix sp.]